VLGETLDARGVAGAVVVVVAGGTPVLMKGYGFADVAKKTPVDARTLFREASISKLFTSLAVMQLVDAGLLHLDDPVQQHLPEFQLADPRAGQVTVRQLLDHTSGITDAVVPELSRDQPDSPRTHQLRLAGGEGQLGRGRQDEGQ